jgi:hypothetical protein
MKTSQNKVQKLIGLKVALVLSLSAFLMLGACGTSENGTPGPTGWSTYTSTATATATCEPNYTVLTPANWVKSPSQLIVVLYDPRFFGPQSIADSDNGQYLQLPGGEKTQDVSYFLSRAIPGMMNPGDQVAVFELGYSSFDDARVGRLRSELTLPPLYNTPAPPNTMVPVPTLGTPTAGLGWIATKNAYKATSTSSAETATESAKKYTCLIDYYNNDILLTSTAYNVALTIEANRITTDLDNGLAVSSTPRIPKEKQFGTNELYYGGVYYGLSFATTIFQSQCSKYDKCLLYIVSDMHHYGLNNPDKLPIDLKGVHTYVIMPSCLDLDQGNCKERADYWSSEFPVYNGIAPVFSTGVDADKNYQSFLNSIGR